MNTYVIRLYNLPEKWLKKRTVMYLFFVTLRLPPEKDISLGTFFSIVDHTI